MPNVDPKIQQELKEKSGKHPIWHIVQNYFDQHFSDSVVIFTDGSKDPDTGCAGAAVYIPVSGTHIKKRVSDHLSFGVTVDRGEGNTKNSYCIRQFLGTIKY